VPGIYSKPWDCKAPLMAGTFSIDIKILGLLKPNILICLDPEIASEKLTSIEGVVSKLSAKLQQAAINNSSEVNVVMFLF
jgi:hypothetical protein